MSTMWDSMLSTSRTVRRGDGLRCLSTAYQDGETALNHQDVLYELELFCEVSGTRFLHVDIAETRRWEDHATSQVPYLTDCGIGFTTNCEDLSANLLKIGPPTMCLTMFFHGTLALGWPNGLLTLLDDQMFAAFPAAVSDEIEEGLDEDPLDKVMDAQDRSAQDRVEDLITEETLADAFDIPGLPADEQERR